MKTVAITVPKGAAVKVFTSPDPAIAFYVHNTAAYVTAYATSHAVAAYPANPGMYMQQRGYIGVRCTGKSLTIENVSPQLSRGGFCRTRRITALTVVGSLNTSPGNYSDPTVVQNTRFTGDIPLTETDFLAGNMYETFNPEGVYMVSAPVRTQYDLFDHITKEVNPLYAAQPNTLSVSGVSLIQTPAKSTGATGVEVRWEDGTITGGGTSDNVFSTALHDGMSTEMVLLSAPAEYDQTYMVKFHARYEHIVDATSPDFPKSVTVESDSKALDDIVHFASLMPGHYPASYNGLGKVWNAFKKGISWVANKVVKPVLSPVIGAALPLISKRFTSAVESALR
jgi:hypothetical protein